MWPSQKIHIIVFLIAQNIFSSCLYAAEQSSERVEVENNEVALHQFSMTGLDKYKSSISLSKLKERQVHNIRQLLKEKGASEKLIQRAKKAKLYIHAYSFESNLIAGSITPYDLIDFATKNHLAGIKIHIRDGTPTTCLINQSKQELKHFRETLEKNNLTLHLEISSTDKETADQLFQLATELGVHRVRVYSRNYGDLKKEVIPKTMKELLYIVKRAKELGVHVAIEQHEDFNSSELSSMVKELNLAINNPPVSLLFDFGNMICSHEYPLNALQVMKPWIDDVHVKDAYMVPVKGNGWAQIGAASGTGEIPQLELLARLLLLDDSKGNAQVVAFGLEEEHGFVAKAYRFHDEPLRVNIPARQPSKTLIEPENKKAYLKAEIEFAQQQVEVVNKMLNTLIELAQLNQAAERDLSVAVVNPRAIRSHATM